MISGALAIVILFCFVHEGDSSSTTTTIEQLVSRIESQQWTVTQKYAPPLRYATQKGLFQSEVHINDAGLAGSIIRREFQIPDLNPFVTMFVVSSLLEAQTLNAIRVNRSVLGAALDAIASYHDANHPMETPAISFWPRRNTSSGVYEAYPPNLFTPADFFGSLSTFVDTVLKDLGLGFLGKYVGFIAEALDVVVNAFKIPSDFDDSGCNLAMGGWLSLLQNDFPNEYATWEKRHPKITSLLDLSLKYGYKPFSGSSQDGIYSNVLDSRSYAAIHPFLESLSSNDPSTTIVSTWIMGVNETRKDFGTMEMPFCVNNVDLSVASNFLYGSINAIVRNLNNGQVTKYVTQSQQFQSLINTTGHLLGWAIDSKIARLRPDIAMLYYPSAYDFYWMVGRIYRLFQDTDVSVLPVLGGLKKRLQVSLESHATSDLLQMAQQDGQYFYFDDFLGDYGGKNRGDDRLFSTSLAAKALLDIWTRTSPNSNTSRSWNQDTPSQVKLVVQGAIQFLNDFVLTNTYVPMCAFFSGSSKGYSTQPWSYPANFAQFRNGTTVSVHGPFPPVVDATQMTYGVMGVIPSQVYAKMSTQKWFNFTVPTNMTDFNTGSWPFWSSSAMTYSAAVLALANYNALIN